MRVLVLIAVRLIFVTSFLLSSCGILWEERLDEPIVQPHYSLADLKKESKPVVRAKSPEEEKQGVYHDGDGNYFYYYNGALTRIGSDKEFRAADPGYVSAKFSWYGTQVMVAFNGGSKVLFFNADSGKKEHVSIKRELIVLGLDRMEMPDIMIGNGGAYLVFSHAESVFYFELGDQIEKHEVPIASYLAGREEVIFMPTIIRYRQDPPAVLIDSFSLYCTIVVQEAESSCGDDFGRFDLDMEEWQDYPE